MAGLDPDQTREPAEQVVPRVQHAAAGDDGGALADDPPHVRVVHGDLREPEDVAGARDVARRVQPVWADEVRVLQAKLCRLDIHELSEAE